MHDRRLGIVPAVFGDPAPAYAPANLELVFLFLMAALRSDALAAVGQLPFAGLAALAIAAAVREAGAGRAAALGAALAFLLVPEVWQQAPTAMVDLGMAACLLAALPFLYRLRRQRRGGGAVDLGAAALALGLGAGTKHVGLLLAVPFALLGARAAARQKAAPLAAALALAVAGGGFWYLRNLLLTGNPVYPVAALGFPGLYDGRTMRAWDYHLPVADLGALGEMLLAAGVGFASAAAVALARAWRAPEAWLSVVLVALFWLAIPYQESRFLFAAFGVAAVALGRGADRPPLMLGWGLLGLAIVAALVEEPTGERLALIPIATAAALAHAAANRLPPRAQALVRRLGIAALAGALVVAFAAGVHRRLGHDPDYGVGDDIDAAWRWFRANVRDTRVAYTGTNLAFPLAGERLSNRVSYVNVAGAPDARLHDFPPGEDGASSPEPAPYRSGARFETWLRNLRAAGAGVLFVAALYPIVRRSIATDADGFPIERAWADAHPALFSLAFASPVARVYRIAPP
jgi:4-amino-4-deoxy-L-arabinose transferase-like glycosyltransferase